MMAKCYKNLKEKLNNTSYKKEKKNFRIYMKIHSNIKNNNHLLEKSQPPY
jgi:hypothetical protein